MATASNVIPFRRPAPPAPSRTTDLRKPRTGGPKRRGQRAEREIVCAVLAEHLGNLERAALIIGHSLQRQRTLLSELKAMEGWDWSIPPASALFGDAILFNECELQVVDRFTKKPVKR